MGKYKLLLACWLVAIGVIAYGLVSSPVWMSGTCFGITLFFVVITYYLEVNHAHGGWVILSALMCGLGLIGLLFYSLAGK